MWLSMNDNYECCIDGRIRNKKTHRILRTWKAGRKCEYIYCRTGGADSKKMSVHRIVANLFLPQPTCIEVEVDHMDRNSENNHASNLRWVSKKVNCSNRNSETKARNNNTTGQLYIRVDNKYNGFVVCIKGKYYGYFKDINDAIKIRDSVINAV